MKSILLIGLGRFGRHMAEKLHELKNEVMAIDMEEERVNAVLGYTTTALIGDCTDEQFVASLGIRNFDLCIVAIGNNFQSSLETTALLKDLGAKHVLARASRDIHAKFLLRNGADDVVYTEKEMAYKTAMKYSYNGILEVVELTPDFSIYEIATPPAWVGMSIAQKAVRSKYQINILAVKQKNAILPLPGPGYVFQEGDKLVVLASHDALRKIV